MVFSYALFFLAGVGAVSPAWVAFQAGGVFGWLEMAAAISGVLALVLVSLGPVAKMVQHVTLAIAAATGGALVLFSLSRGVATATVLYCAAGILWNVARAAANGYLLTVVDTRMIGRVQALTTLLTGGFGILIYLLPVITGSVPEATLYAFCGLVIMALAFALWLWKRVRSTRPRSSICR